VALNRARDIAKHSTAGFRSIQEVPLLKIYTWSILFYLFQWKLFQAAQNRKAMKEVRLSNGIKNLASFQMKTYLLRTPGELNMGKRSVAEKLLILQDVACQN